MGALQRQKQHLSDFPARNPKIIIKTLARTLPRDPLSVAPAPPSRLPSRPTTSQPPRWRARFTTPTMSRQGRTPLLGIGGDNTPPPTPTTRDRLPCTRTLQGSNSNSQTSATAVTVLPRPLCSSSSRTAPTLHQTEGTCSRCSSSSRHPTTPPQSISSSSPARWRPYRHKSWLRPRPASHRRRSARSPQVSGSRISLLWEFESDLLVLWPSISVTGVVTLAPILAT